MKTALSVAVVVLPFPALSALGRLVGSLRPVPGVTAAVVALIAWVLVLAAVLDADGPSPVVTTAGVVCASGVLLFAARSPACRHGERP